MTSTAMGKTLWYYLSPSIETFQFLDTMINSLCKTKNNWKTDLMIGGSLLSFLADLIVRSGGNPVSKKLYSHLLQNSYSPFGSMLNQWVCFGELNDPYKEFMICERTIKKEEGVNENYWDRKYYIEEDQVPIFLLAYQEKILCAGKYLNVLKECDIKLSIESNDETIQQNSNETLDIINGSRYLNLLRMIDLIDVGYLKSNQALLDYLKKDLDLMGHLQ